MVAICSDRRSISASALVTSCFSGASAARSSAACRRAACGVGLAAPLPLGLARRGIGPAALGEALGAVAVHVAVVGAHGAVAHDPQPVGAGLDQVAVVADQDHRALVVVERAHQRLARIDVEMVGGLVEDEQMRAVERRQREQQAGLLAARQVLRLGVGLADAEAERAEPGAALRLGGLGHQVEHVLVGRLAGGQVVHLVLGEIADHDLVGGVAPARHRREAPGDQLGERALAVAVGAEQADAVVGIEPQVEVLQHRVVGHVADGGVLEPDQRAGERLGRVGEQEGRDPLLDLLGDRLHARQRLDAALRLAWPWRPWP